MNRERGPFDPRPAQNKESFEDPNLVVAAEAFVDRLISQIAATDPARARNLERDRASLAKRILREIQQLDDEPLEKKLEKCEKPLIDILRRMNDVLANQFPKIGVQTISSCSGHVREDGSLDSTQSSYSDYKEEFLPHIMFGASVKNISPQQREEVEIFGENFFASAAEQTNKELGGNMIVLHNTTKPDEQDFSTEHGPEENYLFIYKFLLSQPNDALRVLSVFWRYVEQNLGQIDGLPSSAHLKKEDFYHPQLNKRLDNEKKDIHNLNT